MSGPGTVWPKVSGVPSLSSDQTMVFDALDWSADEVVLHDAASAFARICLAASKAASTMFLYPVHRQRLPVNACRTSSSVGSGLWLRKSVSVIKKPGVQ